MQNKIVIRMDAEKIYGRALDAFGEQAQLDILIEEMSELTKAIIKCRRRGEDILDPTIITEMVDVHICLEQLAVMFKRRSEEMFSKMYNHERTSKLKRLEERIDVTNDTNDTANICPNTLLCGGC